jgi:hypothetical protein
MHKRHLHHESTFFCSRLRYDHVFCVLLGGDVDFAIAFGNSNLGKPSRSERKRRKSREQHLDSLASADGL